ncbi:alpha/beta hydrolase [Novosphingobium aquimarinum]|uniref:alpha/beta hydrolase n=1 Tax=Novosphingobium aquimarinum TaxID=2682494 RepID=UPI0012EC2091|nr:alpha/beta hydrolase [Novosphingobium aquimarinum]
MCRPLMFLALLFAFGATPLSAHETIYEIIETYELRADGSERFLGAVQQPVHPATAASDTAIAAFGPFRVLDDRRAALVDVTGPATPGQFAAMLRAYPQIAELDMIDCPGTEDDHANLRLGRMIRSAGIATRVPAGGSVRSGAVELFVAGARRTVEPGAEFAVHAWLDDSGHEADDYALADPENAKYLAYYREMGMSPIEAEAFYAMTNSAPHASARWLNASQMALWVRLDSPVG